MAPRIIWGALRNSGLSRLSSEDALSSSGEANLRVSCQFDVASHKEDLLQPTIQPTKQRLAALPFQTSFFQISGSLSRCTWKLQQKEICSSTDRRKPSLKPAELHKNRSVPIRLESPLWLLLREIKLSSSWPRNLTLIVSSAKLFASVPLSYASWVSSLVVLGMSSSWRCSLAESSQAILDAVFWEIPCWVHGKGWVERRLLNLVTLCTSPQIESLVSHCSATGDSVAATPGVARHHFLI